MSSVFLVFEKVRQWDRLGLELSSYIYCAKY